MASVHKSSLSSHVLASRSTLISALPAVGSAVLFALVVMTFAFAALGTRRAYANGAFPDSLQILLPANHPHRIVLATNFGLVISEDDGATWEWTCEPIANDNTILYQQAAAPSDRLFAVTITHGLIYSDDDACTWMPSGGALSTAVAHDAFADPTNANRVFAVASAPASTFVPSSVYRSDDGGLTFGPALDTAPVGGDMLGVESAVSDPTMRARNPTVVPRMAICSCRASA